jgi:ribose-phosphate pyrophosphokinase
VRRFADEEIFVEIHENVRGEDVFVSSRPLSRPTTI